MKSGGWEDQHANREDFSKLGARNPGKCGISQQRIHMESYLLKAVESSSTAGKEDREKQNGQGGFLSSSPEGWNPCTEWTWGGMFKAIHDVLDKSRVATSRSHNPSLWGDSRTISKKNGLQTVHIKLVLCKETEPRSASNWDGRRFL